MRITRSYLRLRIICALSLIVILGVYLSGCGREKNYSYAEAKIYFDQHKARLKQLVSLVRDCKYAEQINGDTDANGSGLATCSNHDSSYLTKIEKGLIDLKILWVVIDWWTPPVSGLSKHEFYYASFTLTSNGLLGRGTYSAIVYYSTAMAPSYGMKPLTSPPHHWFYRARLKGN